MSVKIYLLALYAQQHWGLEIVLHLLFTYGDDVQCAVPPAKCEEPPGLVWRATRFRVGCHQVQCGVPPGSVPVPPGFVWGATRFIVRWHHVQCRCHQVQCGMPPCPVCGATRSNVWCHQVQCGVPPGPMWGATRISVGCLLHLLLTYGYYVQCGQGRIKAWALGVTVQRLSSNVGRGASKRHLTNLLCPVLYY